LQIKVYRLKPRDYESCFNRNVSKNLTSVIWREQVY
jgi:hypothetical protein